MLYYANCTFCFSPSSPPLYNPTLLATVHHFPRLSPPLPNSLHDTIPPHLHSAPLIPTLINPLPLSFTLPNSPSLSPSLFLSISSHRSLITVVCHIWSCCWQKPETKCFLPGICCLKTVYGAALLYSNYETVNSFVTNLLWLWRADFFIFALL